MTDAKHPPAALQTALEIVREWGRQGGLTRAQRLTPAQRSAIGKAGAAKRWLGHVKQGKGAGTEQPPKQEL